MRLCRYDDDRLGVVRGQMVHDVTEAQAQIRAAAPYAMKGDAVVAALPAWRARLEQMAAKAPGKPVSQVKLLAPVARPTKLVAAPTNYKAHIEEMAARAATQNIKPSPAIGTDVPLTISVNGEVKQESSTKQLIYDCRKLIEWGSTFYTFYPGDVLFTGTPEGVSPVKPGDTMLARIDPIGEMTVPVRAHKAGG